MKRTQIIQYFIDKYNYSNYLEIGVLNTRFNFDLIKCKNKTGVDPAVAVANYKAPYIGHQKTSDSFFAELDSTATYDVVFIDGLHTSEQVDKDIANTIKHLAPNGTVLLHDCSPPLHTDEATPDRCGDVWKSIYKFRKNTKDFFVCVIDTDFGVGVIRRGNPAPLLSLPDITLSYNFLSKHRREVLNLINVAEFSKGWL